MRHLLAPLLLLIALLVPGGARAEQIAGLFEADVRVDDAQPGAQDAAVRAAFADVLVKLAGTRTVLQHPAVAPSLGRSKDYLLQFFRQRSPWPLREGETEAPQLLHASFQPAAVQRILRDAGVPLLAANRPGVLLWLAVQDDAGARLVNRDSDATLSAWLDMHAKRRGVALLYPLLDLEDAALDPAQLLALDSAAVLQASRRYGAAVTVLARLQRNPEGAWQLDWRIHMADTAAPVASAPTAAPDAADGSAPAAMPSPPPATQPGALPPPSPAPQDGAAVPADANSPAGIDGSAQAPAVDVVEGQLVDAIAEAVATRYAIAVGTNSAQALRLRVDGVGAFATYKQVEALLHGLASVRAAQPVLFDRDVVFFDVQTGAAIESVAQELTLIPQLQPVHDADGGLHYRWIGG